MTVAGAQELESWLRGVCSEFVFDVVATYRRSGDHDWPLVADGENDLERQLADGGHLPGLPKEPAALANVLEVAIVDDVLQRLEGHNGAHGERGTERGYPDIEIQGRAFGGGHHAVDVKVARLATSGNRTQSRVTLYTGNTYFRYPSLRWPGTLRPFREYDSHLDIVAAFRIGRAVQSQLDRLLGEQDQSPG